MATLPTYVRLLLDGAAEKFDPAIVKSEMERGLAKQRLGNSRVVKKLSATLLFKTAADATAFEDWYFNTIRRIGFFDVVHPRTGQTIAMRFEGGAIGDLVPKVGRFEVATRAVVLEWLQ